MDQLDHGVAYASKHWKTPLLVTGILLGLVALFTSREASSLIFTLALVIFIILMYFLPTLIARQCKKENINAIFVLNLFLGWTVVGWVVALVWAYTKSDARKGVVVAMPSVLCAACGKYSGGGGLFCSHCGRRLALA